jgi:ABC-type antimicrobial peptide transport system permease subunit
VNGIAPEGSTAPRSEQPPANYRFVGPDFFRTLNIPVVRGRPFRDGEGRGSGTMPALVSDRTALRIWPGENAVGKRFSRGVGGEAGFEVVGIVADAKITSLDRTPPLMVYVPYWWRSRGSVTMLFRTAVEPAAIMADVRRTIAAIDQEIAIGDVRTLDAIVDSAVAGRKYQLRLFVVFGGIALAIAALGVYAVTAYSISRRRREMNIRVALGAQRSQVMRMVVGQSAVPIAAGLAGGSAVALGLGTAVASLLFDVRSRDPLLLSTAVALVASVGVAACVVAASRGLRVDPARALREE